METIKATVKRQIYRQDSSGWSVIDTDRGKCVGVIGWPPATGEHLRLTGAWKKSKYNGDMEFGFDSAMIDIPDDKRSLLKYAVSITKGFGDAKFDDIWNVYEDTWDDDPELMFIAGISLETRDRWKETLERLRIEQSKVNAISWLVANGCTLKMAVAAWQKWGNETIGRVNADCYILTELYGYGFKSVDEKIRVKLGIADDDPRRYDAYVLYMIKTETERNGDSIVNLEALKREMTAALNQELIDDAIYRLSVDKREIGIFDDERKSEWCALIADAYHEELIYERFAK